VRHDLGAGERDLLRGGDLLEGRVEAGGPTGGEQLLGVGAAAGAAEGGRDGQDDVERAVVGHGATSAAALAGRGGGGGVEGGHGVLP